MLLQGHQAHSEDLITTLRPHLPIPSPHRSGFRHEFGGSGARFGRIQTVSPLTLVLSWVYKHGKKLPPLLLAAILTMKKPV